MLKRSSFWFHFFLLFTICFVATTTALAQNTVSEIKIDAKPEAPAPIALKAESKLEIKAPIWSGDLRYRANTLKEDVDQARPYHQLRVRLGVQADVNDETLVKIRLATATSAISTNQTLGDSSDPGMPRRSFGLDLAYAEWKVSSDAKLWVGRTPNPFFSPGKAQTIYDADLAFEGFASQMTRKMPKGNFFLNLGAFMISENYSKPDDVVDEGLLGADIGYVLPTDRAGEFTFHAGRHVFVNIQDKGILTLDKNAKTDTYSSPYDRYRGNVVYPNDPLATPADRRYYMQSKYEIQNAGVQWKMSLEDHQFLVFGEAVLNPAADELNKGYEYGGSWTWGRSTLGASAIFKQSDSVVGAFTDSDANGGGTDNRGQKFNWTYQLSKGSQFILSYYDAERGMDSVARRFIATQADFLVMF